MVEHVVKGPCYGIDLKVPNVGVAQLSNIFIGDSHSEHCRKWIGIMGPFDLVLIDACHEYNDVQLDTLNFAPLATKVLAYHDIVGLRDCRGTFHHWEEVKEINEGRLEIREFIDDECSIGIGAIAYGE